MPESLTMNPQDTRTFPAPIREITVGVGSIVITRKVLTEDETSEIETTTVEAGGAYDGCDTASLALYSPDGARVGITYSDEAPAPQEVAEKVSGVSAAKKGKKA